MDPVLKNVNVLALLRVCPSVELGVVGSDFFPDLNIILKSKSILESLYCYIYFITMS